MNTTPAPTKGTIPFPTYDGRNPTAQEFFDAAVTRFRAQGYQQAKGQRERGAAPACYYRREVEGSTLACLIGCGIPDNVMAKAFEEVGDPMWTIGGGLLISAGLRTFFQNMLNPDGGVGGIPISELQLIHDNAPDTGNPGAEYFEPLLEQWASDAGLVYTAPAIGGVA